MWFWHGKTPERVCVVNIYSVFGYPWHPMQALEKPDLASLVISSESDSSRRKKAPPSAPLRFAGVHVLLRSSIFFTQFFLIYTLALQ